MSSRSKFNMISYLKKFFAKKDVPADFDATKAGLRILKKITKPTLTILGVASIALMFLSERNYQTYTDGLYLADREVQKLSRNKN